MFKTADGQTTDRRTDDGRLSHWLLIAHLRAFGSGELKKQKLTSLGLQSNWSSVLCENKQYWFGPIGTSKLQVMVSEKH